MKQFMILALMVFNHEFSWVEGGGAEYEEKIAKTPGCEKFKDFKDIELKTCCASMPEFNMEAIRKECADCKSKEKGEKMCCFTDCMLKSLKVVDDKGLIDVELMKTELGKLVNKNETWVKTIDEVMADCVKEAPAKLKDWQEKHPDNAPKCETATNIVIKHCMKRNMFLKCPFMDTSDKCKSLGEFGKGCEMFPFWGCKGKKDE